MTAATISAPRFPAGAALAAALWFGLAVVAGATGLFLRLPFPGPQLIIAALVAGTLAAGVGSPRLRAWIDGLPLRVLVGINASRLVGIAFLALAAQGRLDAVFAARAGWGDIAVAVVAIGLVATGGALTAGRRVLLHVWNAFGFLDLIVAVGTATAVTLNGATPGVERILTLPLSIVPTFFVPLFLATHVFIFRRLIANVR